MTTINVTRSTTATPEEFVAGLTDFGPGRSDLFPNSADDYLVVHERGPQFADVTEGSGGVWERLHYDWSDPENIVLTTTDSNAWGGASGDTYTFTPRADGGTDVHAVVVRDGKNLRGWAFAGLFRLIGGRFFGSALEKTLRAIEARKDDPTRTMQAA